MTVAQALNEVISKSLDYANLATSYERILFPFLAGALSECGQTEFSDLANNLVTALTNFCKAVSNHAFAANVSYRIVRCS